MQVIQTKSGTRWIIVDSPDGIKNKRAAINPVIDDDDKCFQYAAKVALDYQEIEKRNCKEYKKIKLFIDKYSSKGIKYQSVKDGKSSWKIIHQLFLKK